MKVPFSIAKTFVLVVIVSFTTLGSCRKKPDPANEPPTNSAQYGVIGFEFSNYADIKPMALNVDTFTTAIGEKIVPTKFNYYISNIKFTRNDGTEFIEPESYHLVSEEDPASKHFHLKDVPVGDYRSITFVIGVDSLRNTSGAQEGALDPAMGMFWTWNSGYIMAKFEGTSPQANTTDKKVIHHIGGFSGDFKAQRTITIDFPEPLVLTLGSEGTIRMRADVLKWFSGTNNVSVATVSNIMNANSDSKKIADNYAAMFSITSITVF
jgi:hypothetical protein